MKIVINVCYGGFGLSISGILRYAEIRGIKLYPYKENGFGDKAKIKPHTGKQNIFIHWATKRGIKTSKELNDYYFNDKSIERTDPILIQVVEEMGKKASGSLSELKVIEIPDGVDWEIGEYDGIEHIDEKHMTWG